MSEQFVELGYLFVGVRRGGGEALRDGDWLLPEVVFDDRHSRGGGRVLLLI